MEKCPSCGAAVRPNAKFCTSCGTRVNEPAAEPAKTAAPEPAAGDTAVATPAARPEQGSSDDPYATWGKPADDATGTPTPADRFEAGLDGAQGDSGADESTTTYGASTWSTPPKADEESDEDRFASWAAAYGTYQPPARESNTGTSEPEEQTVTPAASPVEDGATRKAPDDSEARQRAASLIDELRSLVWQIGVTEKTDGDENMAKVVLAGARGQSSEFSDLQRALDDVKASPRDLDVLAALSGKADRIQELLDSHTRLLGAIDEAIDELR